MGLALRSGFAGIFPAGAALGSGVDASLHRHSCTDEGSHHRRGCGWHRRGPRRPGCCGLAIALASDFGGRHRRYAMAPLWIRLYVLAGVALGSGVGCTSLHRHSCTAEGSHHRRRYGWHRCERRRPGCRGLAIALALDLGGRRGWYGWHRRGRPSSSRPTPDSCSRSCSIVVDSAAEEDSLGLTDIRQCRGRRRADCGRPHAWRQAWGTPSG